MRITISVLAAGALLIGGCAKKPVAPTPVDVLDVDTKNHAVYATTNCTVPNADGVRCDVKTCKKDAASDCGMFRDRCTQSGHQYSGNNDEGTCTRNATPVG